MAIARLHLAALSALLIGCTSPTGSTTLARIVIGTIDAGGTLDRVISAPDTVVVGHIATFTVFTFGNSCIEPAGTEVIVQGAEAKVTPFDQEYLYGTCREILNSYAHIVRVVFAQTGPATIRVRGRSCYQSGLLTAEHQLLVIP
jgi:hypothetical protein